MKTVILGLDAFDPRIYERLSSEGKTPHLQKLAESGGYRRFKVASPPQSEVSWSSIATGLSAGGHGVFDFVHRNPKNYGRYVSLLPTKQGRFGSEFARPHLAHTLFDEAVEKGFPAKAMWWPATFPARLDSPVATIPGLGTPDLLGRLGVGIGFTTEPDAHPAGGKIPVEKFTAKGSVFSAGIAGPMRKKGAGIEPSLIEFTLEMLDDTRARLSIGKDRIELKVGEWSPILELSFKMGLLVSVKSITQVILTRGGKAPQLFMLPLQLHPLRSPWHYATPPGFVKASWQASGGFLSLGWPQDTTALEEGWITDDQFLDLCTRIVAQREKVVAHHLGNFKEGVLAGVFDTLDRVQHMFWRDRPDLIDAWYTHLDGVIGRLSAGIDGKTRLLVVSDHGFGQFKHKVHLNKWLLDQGYLITDPDKAGTNNLDAAKWSDTQAYAVGLNSLYLNLGGREGQGIVSADKKDQVLARLKEDLQAWTGPDGSRIVQTVLDGSDINDGPYQAYGPDLVIGYAPGYRGSAQTGLGEWTDNAVEENTDHWGADHCFDAASVSGVLFSNRSLLDFPEPSFRDFPYLAIGMQPKQADAVPPFEFEDVDQDALSERLKGLGYL